MQTMPSENYSPIFYQADSNIESTLADSGAVEQVPVRYDDPSSTTDAPVGMGLIKKLQEVIRKQSAPTPQVELQSSVNGAVLELTVQSVKCELYTQPSTRIVFLPKAMFPPTRDIRIGLPINLRVERIGGIRKPVIMIREIDITSLSEGADVFDLGLE